MTNRRVYGKIHNKIKNKVLGGKEISYEEALNLISLDTNNKNDFDILLKSANEIREFLWEEKQIYVR